MRPCEARDDIIALKLQMLHRLALFVDGPLITSKQKKSTVEDLGG